MPKQTRTTKPRARVTKNTRTEIVDGDKRTRSVREAEALKQELDAELAAIDEILAENGQTDSELQAFVEGYVQKGGQ